MWQMISVVIIVVLAFLYLARKVYCIFTTTNNHEQCHECKGCVIYRKNKFSK